MTKLKAVSVTSVKAPTPAVVITVEPVSLDIQRAANFIGTSVRQIRTLVYSKELVPVGLGKKHLFLVADLRAFMERERKKAA